MGNVVDRDYLWLREAPKKSPTKRAWAPLALVPIAAGLAWVLAAPNLVRETGSPVASPASARADPVTQAIRVGYVPSTKAASAVHSAARRHRVRLPARSQAGRASTPGWRQVIIRSGDTLSLAFARAGLSYLDSLRIAHLPKLGHYFTDGLQAGDVLRIKADRRGNIKKLSYDVGPLRHLIVHRGDHGLSGALIEHSAEHHRVQAGGVIKTSFYDDALKADLTNRQAATLRHIFSRNVDFGRDIQRGDRFVVIYDALFRDHRKLGNGPILAAALITKGRVIRALRYTDGREKSRYFRPDGRAMRPAFMRAPVDYTHISSPFNLSREHPILHRIRHHEGTDYAAPAGTPIRATGSGRVVFRGRKGGYGKLVAIRHDRDIMLRFAHMSRFARRIHVGSHVAQGQIIGYVGMTGLATGPHVHYEFRVDGKPYDPQRVALPGASPLTGDKLRAFKTQRTRLVARLNTVIDNGTTYVASTADSR